MAVRVPSKTGELDGPKWICEPTQLVTQESWLVYSVSSNSNAMIERVIHDDVSPPHCVIHTFDLHSQNRRKGQVLDFAQAVKNYSTFHHWGFGTPEEAAAYKETGNGKPIKTLAQTMEDLGHSDRRIDVFKIDCEW
jgi:hypothetical protein